MLNFLNKIWKDPVWSKVIATGIITLLVLIVGLYPKVSGWLMTWLGYLWHNLFLYLFILSVIVNVILIIKLNNIRKASGRIKGDNLSAGKETGSNWFINLDDISFYKFIFLLWFPLHRTLQTEEFFNSERFDHIPEFHDLYTKRVIYNKQVSAIHYVIVIDKGVYDYLEEFYHSDNEKFGVPLNNFVNLLKTMSFYDLMQPRRI